MMLATLLLAASISLGGDAFSDLPHDEAAARAEDEGRLLLLDFTAIWCGPCQHMDRTTWVDPDLLAWLDDHAVAIQVDVDDEPGSTWTKNVWRGSRPTSTKTDD